MIMSVMTLICLQFHGYIQLCIRKVDTKAVMTVKTKFAILLIVSRFINIVILN